MKNFTHWKEVLTRLKDGLMPNKSTTGWKKGRTVAYWSVATALLLLLGIGKLSTSSVSTTSKEQQMATIQQQAKLAEMDMACALTITELRR